MAQTRKESRMWNIIHCIEVHASRDVIWNKHIILRYEHRPMVLERKVTLLQAYLAPTSALAMTPSCPSCQQASHAYRGHKITIRLYNCIQGLGTFICSDPELTLTPNHLRVLSNQLIQMSFLGLNFSHIHNRKKHFIIMCAVTLVVANDWIKMNLQNWESFFSVYTSFHPNSIILLTFHSYSLITSTA
jgi:hypothetical protein